MGYSTDFEGEFKLDRPLTVAHANELNDLAEARHSNSSPSNYCQWVPTNDGQGIAWDGNEKFYAYVEWLGYIIENLLKPWGYTLNGEVKWQGESGPDFGIITVKDNVVTTRKGKQTYE